MDRGIFKHRSNPTKIARGEILLFIPLLLIPAELAAKAWPALKMLSPWYLFPAVLILLPAALMIRKSRLEAQTEREFLRFIEYLSAKISTGATLELSLSQAASDLSPLLPGRSALCIALARLSEALHAHADPAVGLQRFRNNFNYAASTRVLAALPALRQSGARLDLYLRQSHRHLAANLALKNQLAAEQSAKRSEAAILIVLPFLLAFSINRGSSTFAKTLNQGQMGLIFSLALYLLALLPIPLLCFLMQVRQSQKGLSEQNRTGPKPSLAGLSGIFYGLYEQSNFVFFGNVKRAFRRLHPGKSGLAWKNYLGQKLILAGVGLSLGLALSSFRLSLFPFISLTIILPLLQDFEQLKRAEHLDELIKTDFPDFIALLVLLLRSGLSLVRSIELAELSLRDRGAVLTPILRDLLRSIHSGQSAAVCIELLAARIPIQEISSTLDLLARYEQSGTAELLDLLQFQSDQLRQLQAQALRRLLERQNLYLMIPMSLDLIVVMLNTLIPTLILFQIG